MFAAPARSILSPRSGIGSGGTVRHLIMAIAVLAATLAVAGAAGGRLF
jgi:hypothetical protein